MSKKRVVQNTPQWKHPHDSLPMLLHVLDLTFRLGVGPNEDWFLELGGVFLEWEPPRFGKKVKPPHFFII